MAKTYKPATERQIKRGKGVSTDELSFNEALKYFQGRGKEKGMNRFRHKGKVYDLTGKEIAPKAAPKAKPVETSPRPKAKPTTGGGRGDGDAEVKRRSADAKPTTGGGRGDGAAEVKRRKTDSFISTMKTAIDSVEKAKTDKMRGNARTSARKRVAENKRLKSLVERERYLQDQLDQNNTALAAAALGAGVQTRGNTNARGRAYNPTYGSQRPQPPGFQGKMNTSVSRPATVGGAKGISGTNPAKTAKRIGSGGRRNTIQDPKDFNNFLN